MSQRLFRNDVPRENPLEETAWLRLIECHGAQRAYHIVRGEDPAANADLAAWRNLGASRPHARKVVRR